MDSQLMTRMRLAATFLSHSEEEVMNRIRLFLRAVRAGWNAGTAQYARVRWHQRRMAELSRYPF